MSFYFIISALLLFPVLVLSSPSDTGNYSSISDTSTLPPIVFVPGDGGSQMEAKLNKTSAVHYLCDKTTSDFFTIWLDVKLLVPLVIDCWVDNIKLNYDVKTKKTYNQPGVETRVPGFGDPRRVEYLDPSKLAITGDYFSYIGDALLALGYQSEINLHGAPFDFRKGPSELESFFTNLGTLVETTYERNNKTKVLLLAHSMGGPLCLVFLQGKPQAWKDKYIRGLLSLSGAYAGSVKALKVFARGDDLGVYLLNEGTLRQVQITMPSSAFLMPHPAVWSNEVLIRTPSKNYSLPNIQEFFNDIGYQTGWEMYQNERVHNKDFKAPGVEVHCLYGEGVSTIKNLVYTSNSKFPEDPVFTYEDGDGTVNLRSLRSCEKWVPEQKQPVYVQGFEGSEHMVILKDKRVIDYIINFISGNKTLTRR